MSWIFAVSLLDFFLFVWGPCIFMYPMDASILSAHAKAAAWAQKKTWLIGLPTDQAEEEEERGPCRCQEQRKKKEKTK